MPERWLLKGGMVVDGTGVAPLVQDVFIEGDRIVALGPHLPVSEGVRVVQLEGMTVCPGFIDLHSHADFTLLAFPSADSALRQGITTIATGNCGGGVAPLRHRDQVGTVAFGYSPDWNVTVDWSSFGEYAARLHATAINVAPLVPHGALRNAVMGMEEMQPNPAELRQMRELLSRCLDEGAFGMSTGLEYQPGMWAHQDELEPLVAEVGARSRLYATHIRGRAEEHAEATAEALSTFRGSGARLQLSHFASRPNAPQDSSEEAFRLVSEAVADGEQIGVDTFPEIWGPALLIDLFPGWALEGSRDQVLARLASERARSAIGNHFESAPGFLARVAGYEEIYIADTPADPGLTGMSLPEIAHTTGRSVSDACCDILLAAQGQLRSVAIRHIYAYEDDLRQVLSLAYCSIESDGVVTAGEDDSCPLVWNASSYGYVARVIEHYVRNVGLFSMQEAVRRMTSLPASSLGLTDRGVIKVGAFADIVVFDSESLRDRSRPEAPARHPSGIEFVMVNGQQAVGQDTITGSRSGKLLDP